MSAPPNSRPLSFSHYCDCRGCRLKRLCCCAFELAERLDHGRASDSVIMSGCGSVVEDVLTEQEQTRGPTRFPVELRALSPLCSSPRRTWYLSEAGARFPLKASRSETDWHQLAPSRGDFLKERRPSSAKNIASDLNFKCDAATLQGRRTTAIIGSHFKGNLFKGICLSVE